jgi:hypothetical protein
MIELIRMSGPTGTIHVLLAVVILVIVGRRVMQLMGGAFVPGPEWDASVNGILFWGGFAAVLGLLGQTVGIYIALTVIRDAAEIAPWIVVEGFMVSFTPTLIGLLILSFALLAWYALKVWGRRSARRQAA